jgi:hypothetical protein
MKFLAVLIIDAFEQADIGNALHGIASASTVRRQFPGRQTDTYAPIIPPQLRGVDATTFAKQRRGRIRGRRPSTPP